MRWIILPRGRIWLTAVAVLLLFVVALVVFRGCAQSVTIDKEIFLAESLEKTKAAQTYRYTIDSRLGGVDRDTEYLSRIEGEYAGVDRVHIKGTLANNPIEFIQVDDTTYMKDQISGTWLSLQGNRLAQTELFITELNPLAVFDFKDVPVSEFKGQDGKHQLMELKPMVQNPYLDLAFTDFTYKIWVNPKDKRIAKTEISAVSRTNEKETLDIVIEFKDYDKEISIQAPQ
ncbi:MAG: hypothetical protein U1D96_07265 [Eubacteriales bacterium]|nr:hypothetical protein [Bacillota bacterium]MBV1726561.1 hypothetical protein [Desulforudis sp.]MDQ7788713.1 hypothetical protein [Clostridia bacterium]MDZ4043276.1 hypothetical protein [Eubacteriales bacterium]MBU4532077.1 hypothetical protein [Bacillota bacterium]